MNPKKQITQGLGIILFIFLSIIIGISWFIYAQNVQYKLILMNQLLAEKQIELKKRNDDLEDMKNRLSDRIKLYENNIKLSNDIDSLYNIIYLKENEIKSIEKTLNETQTNSMILEMKLNTLTNEVNELNQIKLNYEILLEEKNIVSLIKTNEQFKTKEKIQNINIIIKTNSNKTANSISFKCKLTNTQNISGINISAKNIRLKARNIQTNDYLSVKTTASGEKKYANPYVFNINREFEIDFTNSVESPFIGKINNFGKGIGYEFEIYFFIEGTNEIKIGSTTLYFDNET